MTIDKTRGARGPGYLPAASTAASIVPPASTTVPESQPSGFAHYKGASFRHPNLSMLLRRGPTPRMPLRNAGSKRNTATTVADNGTPLDESDFEAVKDANWLNPLRSLPPIIDSQAQHESSHQDSNEGRRDQRRLNRLFQLPAAMDAATDAPAGQEVSHGMFRRPGAVERTRLPAMHSLNDVVQFIHSNTRDDPSGKSIAETLRMINAAVMRNEITLPAITKVADARALLIEVFGKGSAGESSLPGSLRSVHAMLPLWLVNLGKRRTALQQGQAAAVLSVPRHLPLG